MTRPNFLVIGAAKSGTTSLHRYLAEHPEVFMSAKKELNHFAVGDPIDVGSMEFDADGWHAFAAVLGGASTSRAEYEAHFDDVTSETAVGESSPRYLYTPRSAAAIQRYRPDMKLVAILRDPTERAFSHYRQDRRMGISRSPTFGHAIRAEDHDEERPWVGVPNYLRMGRYHRQLQRYRRLFPEDQIFVCLHRDLVADPRQVMSDLFTFLGVDPAVEIDVGRRHNAGTDDPRNMVLHRALLGVDRVVRRTGVGAMARRVLPTSAIDVGARLKRRIRGANTDADISRTGPPPDIRQEIVDILHDDIAQLGVLLDEDLSTWIAPGDD